GRPDVRITKVRPGFVLSGEGRGFKGGSWIPVYIDLEVTAPIFPTTGDIVVEAADSYDLPNAYTIPLPAFDPKRENQNAITVISYIQPAGSGHDINVTIRAANGRILFSTNDNKQVLSSVSSFEPSKFVYLTASPTRTTLQWALRPQGQKAGPAGPEPAVDEQGNVQVADVPQQDETRRFTYLTGINE